MSRESSTKRQNVDSNAHKQITTDDEQRDGALNEQQSTRADTIDQVNDQVGEDDEIENEEKLHERMHKQKHRSTNKPHQHLHKRIHQSNNNNNDHHHHNHRHHHHHHNKELIKADRSRRVIEPAGLHSPINVAVQKVVATVVDEEQLHERLLKSKSERPFDVHEKVPAKKQLAPPIKPPRRRRSSANINNNNNRVSSTLSSTSSSTSSSRENSDTVRSPPPAAIVIPASVAKSLSARSQQQATSPGAGKELNSQHSESRAYNSTPSSSPSSSITREQLEYGPLLRTGEVQVLYRSPNLDSTFNQALKDEQARLVAPGSKQSPVAILSLNPTYELLNKPLMIEYPATVDNLRLNNTGYSWEVKIPYQISMTTALYGAHLNSSHRYRLDQFHCHWGSHDDDGSEHTVDNRSYSAEIHFVHYNMDKYHTMSKAARHPDGLVVLSVFLDAQKNHHNHAELEKVVTHLRSIKFKSEHTIIKQTFRIENLLPANKSYWSYQGSLTTPPYYESVTWFVLKQPVKCSISQINRFRNLSSTLLNQRDSPPAPQITSNHRATQPLNGRTIVTYDEPSRKSNYR